MVSGLAMPVTNYSLSLAALPAQCSKPFPEYGSQRDFERDPPMARGLYNILAQMTGNIKGGGFQVTVNGAGSHSGDREKLHGISPYSGVSENAVRVPRLPPE